MRTLRVVLSFLVIFLAFPATVLAQAGATSAVSGTVFDPSGAVVPGAKLEFVDTATNRTYSQESSQSGLYRFSNIPPGMYRLTVTMPGFRTSVISDLRVAVAKNYTINVTLEVGTVAQMVEVTAAATVELQTTDATVSDVIGGEELTRLPTYDRSAISLLLLQPMVTGGGTNVAVYEGGQVAGSRSDQNTYMVDGGDATNDTEGSGGYALGQAGLIRAAIPVPVESIEEFRVSTTNPDATFGRSSGGAVNLVTKRGTNTLHGSAYWYHQNDNLNANTWDLNRVGQPKPELKDNRYGFSLGGPILKDKTFMYGHYEGRRFPRSTTVTRIVPTASLRQGILRFLDDAGNTVSYDLASSNLCGAAGGQACDPRAASLGFSLSPVMQAYLNLFPQGNDPTYGDGTNTIGFRGSAKNPLETDFLVIRLDHQLSDSWNFFGSHRYSQRVSPSIAQVDIAGLVSGQPGVVVPVSGNPVEPRYWVAGLDGQISSSLTSQFRFSFTRNWWEWTRNQPFPQVPGSAGAIDVGGDDELARLSEPINIDTQSARSRVWNGHDWYFSENLAYVRGKHTIQFGGNFHRWNIFHRRNDKVTGAVDSLIYFLMDGAGISMTQDYRPPTCGAGVTSNCLQSGNVTDWNFLYTAITGLIDRSTILLTRDVALNPNPIGQPLTADVKVDAYEFFAQDTWRVTPSFTVTAGLSYQVQLPPYEKGGKQMVVVFRDSEMPLYVEDYFHRRRQAALQGQIYNPELAWSPIRSTGRKYTYDVDWNNFGPRVAAAWNPSYTDGFWGAFLGDRKTVFRGGYGVTFDRVNGVGLVMTPLLGVGLGQILQCVGPTMAGVCAGSGGADPSNGFRLGVDGSSIPTPPTAPAQIPFPVSTPWGESSARGHDPGRTIGENHSLSFTIQRELPGDLILELGYTSKFGRELLTNVDLNAVPYFHVDLASGQTLAQAFDLVATELRAGVSASAVTPQPWFENQLVAANVAAALGESVTTCTGLSVGSCTAAVASLYSGDFQDNWLSGVFIYDIDADQLGPHPFGFVNVQSRVNQLVTDGGKTDYNAGFLSLRKRMSHGLTFGLNYTFSKALDQGGLNQQYVNSVLTPFDYDIGLSPAFFDRTHSMNLHWFYELPMGRAGTAAHKIIGGWWVSGIYSAMSGLPICVWDGGDFGALYTAQGTCAFNTSPVPSDNVRHSGVTGSGGVGTAGDQNLFADPEAMFNSFRPILFSVDGTIGQGILRSLPRWNLDLSFGKRTSIKERVHINFSFDFLNIFNHVDFDDPSTSFTSPSSFGVLRSQFNDPRMIQFGFRVEF